MTKLSELAKLVGGIAQGGDPEIAAVMPLEWAGPNDISFFANAKYLEAAQKCRAAALIANGPVAGSRAALLVHSNPYLAAAKLARHFFLPPPAPAVIHPSAVIAPEVTLGANVSIGALAVIERGAEIEDGAHIGAQCYVGEGVRIGAGTVLHAGAKVLERCQVGARCVLNAGCVIGGDGFGFAEDAQAPDGERRLKIPQVGIVILEDDVEIGANSTVDRATFGATQIGKGSKIDNLVMVAHNVQMGSDCVIVSQVGISGSSKLGKRVILGGQVGLVGHISLGDDVQVAGQSGVMSSAPAGSRLGGSPAQSAMGWLREQAALRRLDEMRKRVFSINKKDP
jgi:UDP-3-O-[3-hydroxymyristoyl] glucosamine N-acyltransferase